MSESTYKVINTRTNEIITEKYDEFAKALDIVHDHLDEYYTKTKRPVDDFFHDEEFLLYSIINRLLLPGRASWIKEHCE